MQISCVSSGCSPPDLAFLDGSGLYLSWLQWLQNDFPTPPLCLHLLFGLYNKQELSFPPHLFIICLSVYHWCGFLPFSMAYNSLLTLIAFVLTWPQFWPRRVLPADSCALFTCCLHFFGHPFTLRHRMFQADITTSFSWNQPFLCRTLEFETKIWELCVQIELGASLLVGFLSCQS